MFTANYGLLDQSSPQNNKFQELNILRCTRDDFDETFHTPTDQASIEEIDMVIDYSYCIEDPKSLKIAGNIKEQFFNGPSISIRRCTGDGCKSEAEIDAFLEKVFCYVIFNDQKYDPNSYDQNPIHNSLRRETFGFG